MAYEALTCDDLALPVETLLRGAMKLLPDGSWILQCVDVTGSGGGTQQGFDYELDSPMN